MSNHVAAKKGAWLVFTSETCDMTEYCASTLSRLAATDFVVVMDDSFQARMDASGFDHVMMVILAMIQIVYQVTTYETGYSSRGITKRLSDLGILMISKRFARYCSARYAC